MKFSAKMGIMGLMLASGTAFSVEPAMGWYAGFMLGPSYVPSTTFTLNNPFLPTPLPGKLTYKILGNFGGQLGYRCNKLRYEIEAMFNTNKWNELTIGGITIDDGQNYAGFSMKGKTSMAAGLFNVYYEFYDEDYSETTWVPYVGLGLGYAQVKTNLDFYFNNITLNPNNNSQSQNAPIGQAILGLNYFFSDTMSLGADLRYMSTRNIPAFDARYSVGTFNILMNFSFDQP